MNIRNTVSAISLSALLALTVVAAPAQASQWNKGQGWHSENHYRSSGHGHGRGQAYERGYETGYRKGFRHAKKRFKHQCRERHGNRGHHGEHHGNYRNQRNYRNWDSGHEYQSRDYYQPAGHGGSFVDVFFDTLERDLRLIVHRDGGHRR